jgi:acyl-CoA synthetase (AMP-forming)/AMP-acid ligase II
VVGHAKNIVDVVSARSSSDALAYVVLADGTSASEQRWTFADTARNSRGFAAHLEDRGLGAGSLVMLAMNPSLEYIAALFGIMQLGAIPVPCFPPLRAKDFDRFHAIALDCSPDGIVVDAMYWQQMEALQELLKPFDLDPAVTYAEDVTADATNVDTVSPAPEDLALIQYTSGSTGSPKGVCLTHDNLASNCQALDRSMGHDPDRVGLSWLPPYHDMGLMGTIVLSMYHGWPLVLMSPLHFVQQPRRWLKAITDYRVSITVGPNFSLDLCADAMRDGGFEALDLSTVKELYCGAEPISDATLARFEATSAPLGFDGRSLIPCYGMAEATLFVSGKRAGSRYRAECAPQDDGDGRLVVSCGEVDSEHTVRIVDTASHAPLPDSTVGEIWVSGRSVAAGYFNRPELTREVFDGRLPGDERSYLRTGDLGFVQSGELFVTGRIKDLIIFSGRNIYPQDVEAAVMRADAALRGAAAFAVEGERLVVLAEATRKASPDSYPAMVDNIRSSVTSEFGVGPDVHLCSERSIPTTTSGKVRRHETRRMFLGNEIRLVYTDSLAIQDCTA